MSAIEEIPDSDPRPPLDYLDFNDPEGWGYCEHCAFSVAVKDGIRLTHRLTRVGSDKDLCRGSSLPPIQEQPTEATPKRVVSFRKDLVRARQRGYHQRLRFIARELARTEQQKMEAAREEVRARFKAKPSRPIKVELLDQHGEVIADITDSVTSVRLEADCGE